MIPPMRWPDASLHVLSIVRVCLRARPPSGTAGHPRGVFCPSGMGLDPVCALSRAVVVKVPTRLRSPNMARELPLLWLLLAGVASAMRVCPLCSREIPAALESRHHLVPKLKGGKTTEGNIVVLHRACHDKVHAVFTEADLARNFASIESLLSDPEIAKFSKWIAKRPIEFNDRTTSLRRRRQRGARMLAVSMCAEPEPEPEPWFEPPPASFGCGRSVVVRALCACAALGATTGSTPPALASSDGSLDALLQRFDEVRPKQQGGGLTDGLARSDPLRFPSWMEGEWHVTSRPLGNAAPLGQRFLPSDLARMRLGDVSDAGAPPLRYTVRFARRRSDNAVVSDRAANLRAVQDAAAGYRRVDDVTFDGVGALKVAYSPFGPNGTYPGPSRADIYLNWRRQSDAASATSDVFAFSEATRSVPPSPLLLPPSPSFSLLLPHSPAFSRLLLPSLTFSRLLR